MSSKELFSNDAPIDADLARELASLSQGGLFSDQQGGGSASAVVLPVAEVRGGGTDQGMLVEEEVVVSGVEDSVNVSKKYRVFLMPDNSEEVSNLCGFSIGGGSRVCVKHDCSVNHRGKEMTKLVTGAFYVLKSNGEIFAEPSVPSTMLTTEVYADWIKAQKSLDEWTQNFKSASTSYASEAVPVTKAELLTKQAFFDMAQVFRTPGKKKTVVEEEMDLPSSQLSLSPYERKVTTLESFSIGIPEVMKNLYEVVYYLDERAANSSEVLGSHLSRQSEFVENSWKSLKTSESRIDFLVSSLGSKPIEFTQDHDTPTIWGSLSSVTEAVVKLAAVESISKEEVKSWILRSRHEARSEAEVLVEMEGKGLQLKLDGVKKFAVAASRSLQENMVASFAKVYSAISDKPFSPSGDQSTASETRMQVMMDRMLELEAKVLKMSAATNAEAIKFAGLGFTTSSEAAAWLEIHASSDYGFLVDFHTVMEHVSFNVSTSDTLATMTKLQKLKVSSMSEGVVITSFERVTPKYFSKSNDHVPSKNTESCFDAIPSWEGWSKQQGFKDRLSAELQTFKIAHAQTIDNALGFGELRNLAIMSLTESVAFAEALIKFLDETVEEFRVTKLGNAKSFHIGTSMVLAVIKYIASPRTGIQKGLAFSGREGRNDASRNAQNIFWAQLRSLDKMAKVRSLRFRELPEVSAALIMFLGLNTGIESIEKLQGQMLTLEPTIKSASNLSKEAVNTAKKAVFNSEEAIKLAKEVAKKLAAK